MFRSPRRRSRALVRITVGSAAGAVFLGLMAGPAHADIVDSGGSGTGSTIIDGATSHVADCDVDSGLVDGASTALPNGGCPSASVPLVGLPIDLNGYLAAIQSTAWSSLNTTADYSVTFDSTYGTLDTAISMPSMTRVGVPGVGIPVVGPFRRFIPEPVDRDTVDGDDSGDVVEASTGDSSGNMLGGATTLTGTTNVGFDGGNGTEGSCNPNGEGLIQHDPGASTFHDFSIYMDYTVVPYERPAAHTRPDGQLTYQVALCAFGNSKTINGYRLLQEGMGITLWGSDEDEHYRIGQSWDTSVSDGMSSGEVNFNVPVAPAKVGVTLGTTPVGRNYGSAGLPGPQEDQAAAASLANVVEAWWNHNSSWQVPWRNRGSRDPQATIAEGLYELTYAENQYFNWVLHPYATVRCTAFGGCLVDRW